MRRIVVIVACCMVFLAGCRGGKEEKAVESRWRMSESPVYDLVIDEAEVFVSLDEFEKLLFAPLSHFERSSSVRGFSQELSFETTSVVEGVPRRLFLSEKVLYGRDEKDDFHLSYLNDRNEGWDIVWKENFLYKKLLGGEYVRTSSLGEHTYYKEMLFRAIPDIYAIFRNRATMSATSEKNIRRVTIRFSDKEVPRGSLPSKRYLQNAYGTEEINNDRLIEKLAGKNFAKITGTMDAEVTAGLLVRRLTIDISFTAQDEETSFVVRGERTLADRPLLEITVPPFVPEYHRRSFDAAKNIMEKGSSHEER